MCVCLWGCVNTGFGGIRNAVDVRNCFKVGFSYYSNIPGVSPWIMTPRLMHVRKGESERAS